MRSNKKNPIKYIHSASWQKHRNKWESDEYWSIHRRKSEEELKREVGELAAEDLIPHSDYCYTVLEPPTKKNNYKMKIKPCPFYDKNPTKPEQQNGYCHFLKAGDWEEDGAFLLWDMVKECGINLENE